MSLLADLLAKVKSPPGGDKEVPPGLKEIVGAGKKRGAAWQPVALLTLLTIAAIMAGIMIVNYLQASIDRRKMASRPLPVQASQPVMAARQPRLSSVTVAALPARVAPYPVVKPIPQQKPVPQKARTKRAASRKTILDRVGPHKPAVSALPQPARPAEPPTVEANNDDRIDAFIYAGRQFEEEQNYAAAITEYEHAIRLKPADPFLLNAIAYLYARLQMHERGLHYALLAVNASRDYAPALVNAGICYAKLGKMEEAEQYFKQALESPRFNREALYNLGLFYEKEKRGEESLKVYRKMVDAGDAAANIHVGRVFEMTGQREAAARVYQGMLEAAATSKESRKYATKRLAALQAKP
jgi:tetratricopeptide (TPR) repeat protein